MWISTSVPINLSKKRKPRTAYAWEDNEPGWVSRQIVRQNQGQEGRGFWWHLTHGGW